MISVNSHHVKPAGRVCPISMSNKIKQRRTADNSLFAAVYCCRSPSAFCTVPVLYFNKYQIFSVSGNQINLSQPAAKILFFNLQAILFQKNCCYFFIAAAQFPLIYAILSFPVSVGIFCNYSCTKCVIKLFR